MRTEQTSGTRVCVIGAGSSGIVACKVLRERGLPVVCYEVGSGIGGNWRFRNDNGMSSAYRSLHINTNRYAMAYADFPMPESYPMYPRHDQILAYFEDYVDHFGVREAIQFRTAVEHVRPVDGGFEVTVRKLDGTGRAGARAGSGDELASLRTERFTHVVVANGHHWSPRRVSFPGDFAGEVLHSHDYETPGVLTDRRVLVVGIGNSAADIASEAVRHAEATFLSVRRGAHIVPKYVLGRPYDTFTTPLTSRLPWPVQRFLYTRLLRVVRGDQGALYGFPTPDYPFGSEHPTVSSHLLDHVGHGRIAVKPEVRQLDGDGVVFDDGTREAVDVIVTATGYDIDLPFLDADVLDTSGNRVELYKHVVHPDVPGLTFVGLVQPLGAIMPIAERQSAWVADLVTGAARLPSPTAMRADIDATLARMRKRYVGSPRHTIQVDFHPYLREIDRARARGRRLART